MVWLGLWLVLAAGCGDDVTPPDAGRVDAAGLDGGLPDGGADAGRLDAAGLDAGPDAGDPEMPTWDPARYPWPMFGQNPRRTGRSPFVGPRTAADVGGRGFVYRAAGGRVINMQPTVTSDAVYFGTWGVLRRGGPGQPSEEWNKSDGRFYGLHLVARPEGQERFAPFDPAHVPYCYRYAPHPRVGQDAGCGPDRELHLSWYNGTIEGTAAVDPETGSLVVGVGDGRVFAVDPGGAIRWTFRTFDPTDPDDPEGGGEVVGGPVIGPGRQIYFATWGLPWPSTDERPGYETHAVYALSPDGELRWRLPRDEPHLHGPMLAAPASSPDGRRLYVATWFSAAPGAPRLVAVDLTAPPEASDDERIAWELELVDEGRDGALVWARHLTVGADGTIFVGGAEAAGSGAAAAVAAVRDLGDRGELAWSPAFVTPHGYPDSDGFVVAGIAAWEVDGRVERIYASTTHPRGATLTDEVAALFALDPRTGAVTATFEPGALDEPVVGGLTSPTLGDDGTIYVGVRGRHDLLLPPGPASAWRDGAMFALRAEGDGFEVLFRVPVDGVIDWAHPAIGANGGLYFGSSDRYSPLRGLTWYAPGEPVEHGDPAFHAVFD